MRRPYRSEGGTDPTTGGQGRIRQGKLTHCRCELSWIAKRETSRPFGTGAEVAAMSARAAFMPSLHGTSALRPPAGNVRWLERLSCPFLVLRPPAQGRRCNAGPARAELRSIVQSSSGT